MLHVNKRQSHTRKGGCNYHYRYCITKKVKLNWTQCLIRCIRGTSPDTPDLCTRWNVTVNCTPPLGFPRRKISFGPTYSTETRTFWRSKISMHLSEIELTFHRCPVRSLFTILTELYHFVRISLL